MLDTNCLTAVVVPVGDRWGESGPPGAVFRGVKGKMTRGNSTALMPLKHSRARATFKVIDIRETCQRIAHLCPAIKMVFTICTPCLRHRVIMTHLNVTLKIKVGIAIFIIIFGIIFASQYLELPRTRFILETCADLLKVDLPAGEPTTVTERLTEMDLKVNKIFDDIDHIIPNVAVRNVDMTTSPENSKGYILNPQESYCIEDRLTLQLDVYNNLGNKKNYGGDFLRARIYSPDVQAASSGDIEDLQNGSYHIHFTLKWPGKVLFSLMLMHSSEGVSALWRARNKGFDNVGFVGQFASDSEKVLTPCGFYINTTKELCEYVDQRDGESFYCIRPGHLSCEAFTDLKSDFPQHTYMSATENSLFQRTNTGVEIRNLFSAIDVNLCNRNVTMTDKKCKIGMRSLGQRGYYLNNVWYPVFCAMTLHNPDLINACIPGKQIHLLGDSTLRQWIEYFPKILPTLKFIDLHGIGKHQTYFAVDADKNLLIEWKRHGHPFVAIDMFYTVKNHAYVARRIDRLVGGPHSVIVLTLAHHFRFFPLHLFIKRVINVRKAVERLLIRSPETKVIVKTENTRDISMSVEILSDFHGYIQYITLDRIFEGLNVGIIDAWDMTVAFASNDAHPPDIVLTNQMNLFLTYIC